jgi:hypothetical protein
MLLSSVEYYNERKEGEREKRRKKKMSHFKST